MNAKVAYVRGGWRQAVTLGMSLLISGCGSRGMVDDGSGSETSASSGTGSDASTGTDSETDAGNEDVPPDMGNSSCGTPGPNGSCSVWCQDCPDDTDKCAPIVDAVDTFTATACTPVVSEDAKGSGEACVATYEAYMTGVDDCAAGLYCWNVQAAQPEPWGTCFPFCGGTPDAPDCAPGTKCMRHPAIGEVALCMALCDPLTTPQQGEQFCQPSAPSCLPPDCFPLDEEAGMWQSNAPVSPPAVGEPCSTGGCGGNGLCAPVERTGDCGGALAGCCAAYCDLDAPDCATGTCQPVFEMGAAPSELSHLGVCLAQ